MNRVVLWLAVLALAAPANADEHTADIHLAAAREAHVRGDFAVASVELDRQRGVAGIAARSIRQSGYI